MTREQYIERLIAIYKLRYKPSQEEIEEFKLLMEMMPNNIESIGVPYEPMNPRPWDNTPVMYGVQVPDIIYDFEQTTHTMTKTDEKGR